MNNLSTYRTFGPHLRSILARRSITELRDRPQDQWRLREHAQVLYTLFPTSQLLVQRDHVAWVRLEPLAADATRLWLGTLAPEDRLDAEEDLAHWAKNHGITLTTLAEDFDIAESIQEGLDSGANDHLTFARFEGALGRFNETVRQAIAEP